MPSILALPMLDLSKKDSRYRIDSVGTNSKSILRTRRLSSCHEYHGWVCSWDKSCLDCPEPEEVSDVACFGVGAVSGDLVPLILARRPLLGLLEDA